MLIVWFQGEGGFKSQTTVLEGKYEAKLEFPAGCGGAKQKTLCGGSMDIFWNYTLLTLNVQRTCEVCLHTNITPGSKKSIILYQRQPGSTVT